MKLNKLLFLIVFILFNFNFFEKILTKEINLNSNSIKINVHFPQNKLHSGSNDIYLRGSLSSVGLSWNSGLKMNFISNNTWSISLNYDSSIAGQKLEMKPLVEDKVWSIGANFFINLPSTSQVFDIYPWFYSTQGKYEILENQIYSPQLKNLRSVIVYTPPSYYENTLKTIKGVLIMHDGENLFNDSTSFGGISWHCQTTVDQLVYQGQMEEIIIIGLYNTPERIDEYTYSYDPECRCPVGAGGNGDLYIQFIQQTVIPAMQPLYRMDMSQSNLGILGSSLGGLISCYAGWTRSNVFGKIGCMSSSFWWNTEDFNNDILNRSLPQQDLLLYLDSGTSGDGNDDLPQTTRVVDHLKQLGYKEGVNLMQFIDVGGQHNEYYWGKRFHVPMKFLYPVLETKSSN
eukprot:TRINITY_DN2141_c0_g1_i1.p1 TRINITY_DN2141_c0_g1~~TRINITY_DN2141_c0_g1_i1.p1  ORF type:complete len:401 (+),score=142.92 TRINITY_DN2141_c0_g1_i1:102-1304(+)